MPFPSPSSACSGNTLHVPELLKYSCKLETNLRLTSSALSHTFGGLSAAAAPAVASPDIKSNKRGKRGKEAPPHVHHGDRELLGAVFGGRPLLAMAFDNMVVSASGDDKQGKQSAPRSCGHRAMSKLSCRRPDGQRCADRAPFRP